jgi:hypothetical protein
VAAKTNGSPGDPVPQAEPEEESSNGQYESDVKELVERFIQLAAPGRSKPVRPSPEESAEPTALAEPEAAGEAGEPDEAGSVAASEDEPPDGKAAESEDRTSRVRVLTLVSAVLALLFAATSTSTFLLWRNSAGESAKQDLATRAGQIAGMLYNYDYRHVDQYLAKQPSVMTKAMADQAKSSRGTISAIITGGKLVWTSRVTQVYVADIHRDTAWVIVELSGRVTNSKSISSLTGTVVRFKLAKEHGVWLAAQAPETLIMGQETDTDLQGNPLRSSTPTPSPSPSK